jgi:hypothetical protein
MASSYPALTSARSFAARWNLLSSIRSIFIFTFTSLGCQAALHVCSIRNANTTESRRCLGSVSFELLYPNSEQTPDLGVARPQQVNEVARVLVDFKQLVPKSGQIPRPRESLQPSVPPLNCRCGSSSYGYESTFIIGLRLAFSIGNVHFIQRLWYQTVLTSK